MKEARESMILFDMDGTLTPARLPVEKDIVLSLKKLSRYAKIGIVTGSGMNYLEQQCGDMWNGKLDEGFDPRDITLMPCNGTQKYRWCKNGWSNVLSLNMKEQVGEDCYKKIISAILEAQSFFMKFYDSFPASGTFISYRESMINWCPIGRDCSFEDRDFFSKEDINGRVRRYLKKILISKIEQPLLSKIDIVLGGNTSFDIYPSGWDKSFALSHLKKNECWFVGDKCFEDGNDRAIYDVLRKEGRAYSTESPENTIKIINDIISKIK